MAPKILVVSDFPYDRAPGPRFRYEQYLDMLRADGFQVDLASFYDEAAWAILYQPGQLVRKIWAVVRGFGRRLKHALAVWKYDFVFLYLEAAPIGPPLFEALLFALKRRVIYDFDDAIFVRKKSQVNRLATWLKWPSKVPYIARHSYKISVSNQYLADWARQHNRNVVLLPTSFDPTYHRAQPKKHQGRVVIGWTGTHTTMRYLEIVRPVLRRLQNDFDFDFRVICNADPNFSELRNYQFVPWKKATEIEDLNEIDIGLMPVPDGVWEQGKIGFKSIQYSAMEIVAVISDVGSAHEIVQHGVTGFVVSNTEEAWTSTLAGLLSKPESLLAYGKAAREFILQRYSVPVLQQSYRELFT